MSKQSDHKKAIKDEAAAEKLHQAHEEAAKAESKQVAAAEEEATLRKIEEARLQREAHPVKRTFWSWITNWSK